MRKLFLLGLLIVSTFIWATPPTITIDGDKSEWAEVPMLTEPGAWPMLKVLPAADAELGTNALVYMMENTADFDPTWSQYPKAFIDKDYDGTTHTIDSYWAFDAMGLEYSATTGVTVGEDWVSFPKAISADNKVFELGFPATYVTDLGSKFGFAMYYNSGAWYCPDRSEPAVNAFDPKNGFLYKTRSFTSVSGNTTLTTANVFAHPSMGEIGEYVDFGLRDNGYDTIRWAAFPIELTAPAVYELTTNVTTTNAWKFEFWLVDVETNAVVAHIDPPASSLSSSATSHNFGAWDLTAIPSGKYMLKVKNRTAFSKVKLNSIVLEYKGGAPVAIPGTLSFDDVILSDEAWIDKSGAVDSLLFTARGSEGHNSANFAKWKVQVTQAGAYDFTANVYRPDGNQRYEIKVLNLDESSELISNSLTGMPTGNASISSGCVYLEEGVYTVKIRNTYDYAKSRLLSVVATCIGGAVQNMPGTTNINDAWFSANGTRADGKITYTSISSGCWAKWNINVASAGTYNVIVNIQNVYGHNYAVEFLKEGEITPISIDEGGTTYGNDATLYPVEVGAVTLEPGNYEMKVSNAIGDAALLNVTLAYAGGAAVELSKTTPASLLANADAILSNDWTIEAGQISYSESKATTGWAKWNVNCADYGNYTMTVNISSDNGHGMRVEVFEDEAQPAIYTLDEPSSGKYHTGDLALDLGSIVLADRDYVVKITNTVSSSHAKITSIVITYLNGAQATLPATFNFEDGMLSEKAHITAGELWFNTIGDSNPVGQWAKWNVKVAEASTFLFTMNTNSTNDQKYKVTILDENDNEIDAFESKGYSSGAVEIKHYFNLAAGNYTVKLENTKSWSQGHIVSLMVTQPSLLVLNEAAETNTVIHDNYRNGAHDIQIIRTIVAGMYNTICLPFDVNSTQLQAIFGSDVELRQMSSAELNGNELDLNFEAATSIYRGTPYLIKTSKTVTNPVFADVEIKEKTGQATSTDKVDFIGSFIKGEVPAGEDNLFLGQNDMLYFSSTATPIKGMRAWFKVKVLNPQHVIQHARIVTGGQVVTSIDLVNGDIVNETVKTIENGQLVIIRDGVRYNAMGIRLQ